MLTFHSNNQIIINVRDNLGTDLNSKINQITFKNNSKEIFKNGDVSVFQYQSKGSDINSFGCFNYGNIALNIILSFDYDDNIIVAGNVYEIQKVVSPNSYEFFANIYNDNDRDIKFNLSYNPIE
jgi:Zn/Cd-binding protein ZinT